MVNNYIPQKGDLVILTFEPYQDMIALIKVLGLAIACPRTNTNREFPFHVEVSCP